VAVEVVGCKAVGMIRISSVRLPWQGCRELRNLQSRKGRAYSPFGSFIRPLPT
jgi:hypothetical protein